MPATRTGSRGSSSEPRDPLALSQRPPDPQGEVAVRGGLTGRTIAASAVLALLIGAVFVVLVRAIAEQRDSAVLATRSEEAIARAFALERLVLDLETGQRGYLVTREDRFLEPSAWPRRAGSRP
jgi:hypothetical protein